MTQFKAKLKEAQKLGLVFLLHNQPYGSSIIQEAVYDADARTVSGMRIYKSVTNRLFHHSSTREDTTPQPVTIYHVSASHWRRGEKVLVAM